MGTCWSATKVSGSSSQRNSNNNHRENRPPPSSEPTTTSSTTKKQQHQKQKPQRHFQPPHQHRDKGHSKRPSGVLPCGKRTDFGYAKDFDKKYSIGKLLGHGQFGYTFVATDKGNGDRVAVKRIEKNKVFWELGFWNFRSWERVWMAERGRFFVLILWWPFSWFLQLGWDFEWISVFFSCSFFFFFMRWILIWVCVLGFNAIQFHFKKLCCFRDFVTWMISFGGFWKFDLCS